LEEFVNSRALLNCDEGLKTASKAAFEAFLFLYLAIFEDVVPINVKIKTELPVGAGLGYERLLSTICY
jgi:mevalonate kinase